MLWARETAMAKKGGWGNRRGVSLSSLEMAICFAVADRVQATAGRGGDGRVDEAWLLEMLGGIAGRVGSDYEGRIRKALEGLETKGVLEKRRDGGAWTYALTALGQQVVADERPGFVQGLAWRG